MYIQRNQQGEISGAFANRQDGYAEEYVAEDAPELVAWLEAVRAARLGN